MFTNDMLREHDDDQGGLLTLKREGAEGGRVCLH